VGPAVYAYVKIARAFKRRDIWVSPATLRDGLLAELLSGGIWSDTFRAQIRRSALELGRRYEFHEGHAVHVAALSRMLYQALQDEHRLDARCGDLLQIAALLHEIGVYVSNRSHHKHSMYLIMNSELFGLGRKDLLMVALIARYHRRAQPRASHQGYQALDQENRVVVAKLAAILRVADALERSHTQRIKNIRCQREEDRLVIEVPRVADLSLEQLAVREKGAMFEDVFGLRVHVRRATRTAR
jgi:exopolyphosphatase/guanosine-5'-triphosphate,3'-diphosphate pyrophosphatase